MNENEENEERSTGYKKKDIEKKLLYKTNTEPNAAR